LNQKSNSFKAFFFFLPLHVALRGATGYQAAAAQDFQKGF